MFFESLLYLEWQLTVLRTSTTIVDNNTQTYKEENSKQH